MAYLKSRNLLLLITAFIFSNCNSNLDFSGFVRSTDRIDTRFEQSAEWNKTHPFKNLTVSSETYQLLVAGDSHIGGLVNYQKFLNQAQKPENTAFVIVGDMVTGKREDFITLKNALPDFDQTPYFLMMGNHELYFDGWKNFYEFFGSSVYYFTVQTPTVKDIYICLDSGSGTLGAKQLAWLTDLLASERSHYRNCIVFSHVNFFRNRHTGSTNPLVTELYVLMDLFVKYNVNYIISGHDHVRSINEFANNTYITMDALKDNVQNASYLKLNISASKADYEFQSLSDLN